MNFYCWCVQLFYDFAQIASLGSLYLVITCIPAHIVLDCLVREGIIRIMFLFTSLKYIEIVQSKSDSLSKCCGKAVGEVLATFIGTGNSTHKLRLLTAETSVFSSLRWMLTMSERSCEANTILSQ